ncbi:MAG: nucleotide exchange factor GrpE [Nanoarchaeota archaeon]|nr:nucleotide exchange factor GrpE [Nanoarchaeota archaeon]MBU1598386.1 nucleotide exchange factor GrpE [Nanoarchaeota archaeon]MBU2441594.1 nucleotide exchange factor GrpE [Nanoarchaeota archaeon]
MTKKKKHEVKNHEKESESKDSEPSKAKPLSAKGKPLSIFAEQKEPEQKIEETAEKKPDTAEIRLKEMTESLQRLQAEFENYKKRCDKENASFVKFANADLISTFLPIIDNFELALKNCRAKDDFYKGMELIHSQLIDTLQSQGLKHLECEGKKFDPYCHEALLTEESDKEQNTVLEELQKGYLLNDKVLRHSKVKVSKKLSAGPQLEKKEE